LKEKLKEIISEIRGYLDERDMEREKLIVISRDVIRLSGNAIVLIEKGDFKGAEENINKMKELVEVFLSELKNFPELYYSGIAYNMLTEYAEAILLFHIMNENNIISYKEMNISPVPYLLGLGDVIGEIRRVIIDMIRKEDFENAWKLFEIMEEVFFQLSNMDYPDALVPGLRHKVDTARRLIDDTKYFLIDMESRHFLKKSLSIHIEE
jgi:translin